MELLAPAGNIDNFYVALDAGADAVYVGVPQFNARNLARDLRVEEIGAMIDYCHARGKKLYAAANSMVLEKELPDVIETLALLNYLQPDGLIVQDTGLINLVRRFFPDIKLHASTLAAVHNIDGVKTFERLGCERVVLARELTLPEIANVARRTNTELEVFVHGAMCFSYSGLCLFSSYLGGKSGLRGRCVQPCRRGYTPSGGKKGSKGGGRASYLFSMNDLDGLEAVQDLKEMGISSLKIEGRLRSARYVEKVVQAYRLMIDATKETQEKVLPEARKLIEEAMSRKTAPGYFFAPQPAEAISPLHSGNMGLHLGRAGKARREEKEIWLSLTVKSALVVGDRLRLHFEPSGDRLPFTVKALRVRGKECAEAAADTQVEVLLPIEAHTYNWKNVDCYKVDLANTKLPEPDQRLDVVSVDREVKSFLRKEARRIQDIKWKAWEACHSSGENTGKRKPPSFGGPRKGKGAAGRGKGTAVRLPLEWWLKLDSVKPLLGRLEFMPDRFLLPFDKQNITQAGELKKRLGKQARNITWTLPPIMADRDWGRVRKQLDTLIRTGFRCYQLGHISQLGLFEGQKVFLSGDYTLNLLNNQALLMVAEAGLECAQLAIEADREGIAEAIQGYKQTGVPATKRSGGARAMRVGLTVYGTPPLFTSRISAAPFFPIGQPVISPKQESFVITKKDGMSLTRAIRPFSLIPYLHELKGMGVDYVVVDLCGTGSGKRELQDIGERLRGVARGPKLSTFNYLGQLE